MAEVHCLSVQSGSWEEERRNGRRARWLEHLTQMMTWTKNAVTRFSLVCLATLFVAQSATAITYVSDSFESSALDGGSGWTSAAWDGAFHSFGTPGLSYSDSNGEVLEASGGRLRSSPITQSTFRERT